MGGVPQEAQAGVQPRYDMEARLGDLVLSQQPGTRSAPQGQSSTVTEKATASGGSSRHRQGDRPGGWRAGPQATPRTGRTSLRDPQVAQSIFGS